MLEGQANTDWAHIYNSRYSFGLKCISKYIYFVRDVVVYNLSNTNKVRIKIVGFSNQYYKVSQFCANNYFFDYTFYWILYCSRMQLLNI